MERPPIHTHCSLSPLQRVTTVVRPLILSRLSVPLQRGTATLSHNGRPLLPHFPTPSSPSARHTVHRKDCQRRPVHRHILTSFHSPRRLRAVGTFHHQ